MKLNIIQQYCGGRFLVGLHNTPVADPQYKIPGFLYEKIEIDKKNPQDYGTRGDPYPYVPGTLLEFQQILYMLLNVDIGKDAGFQGVVYAVTNPSQTQAARYLEESGFKNVGEFRKTPSANECISWLGDYRNSVYPILSIVTPFQKVKIKNESKFAASTAPDAGPRAYTITPIPPLPPIQPEQMPNTIRRSQEQMVRALYR